MKKCITMGLAALLLLMLCITACAATPRLTVSNETAKAGDEVIVSVSAENNPGVAALLLGIDYDKSKLEYVGFANSGISGWTVSDNAVWVGNEDSTCNGEILKLRFKVKEEASGTAVVSINCGSGDAYNYNEEPVSFTAVSGGVTVQGAPKEEMSNTSTQKTENAVSENLTVESAAPEGESADLSVDHTPAFVPEQAEDETATDTAVTTAEDGSVSASAQYPTDAKAVPVILIAVIGAVALVAILVLRGRKHRS